jgi:hypothetical protein
MNRWAFIAGVGSVAAWPLVPRAQQGDRVRHVGCRRRPRRSLRSQHRLSPDLGTPSEPVCAPIRIDQSSGKFCSMSSTIAKTCACVSCHERCRGNAAIVVK